VQQTIHSGSFCGRLQSKASYAVADYTLIECVPMRAIYTLVLAGALTAPSAFSLDKTDVEYSRPDGKPLLLDIHIPDGKGPFAAAIVVHGGGFDQGTKKSYVGPVL